jgi:hypothetical protein
MTAPLMKSPARAVVAKNCMAHHSPCGLILASTVTSRARTPPHVLGQVLVAQGAGKVRDGTAHTQGQQWDTWCTGGGLITISLSMVAARFRGIEQVFHKCYGLTTPRALLEDQCLQGSSALVQAPAFPPCYS